MQRILPEIQQLGAQLIAISPELPERSLAMIEKNLLTYPVLHDRGNALARQCGLVYSMTEELRPIYLSWGIDLPAANGDTTYELPLPATYVVDRKARIVLSFVDADYTKRLEPSAILEALKGIAG